MLKKSKINLYISWKNLLLWFLIGCCQWSVCQLYRWTVCQLHWQTIFHHSWKLLSDWLMPKTKSQSVSFWQKLLMTSLGIPICLLFVGNTFHIFKVNLQEYIINLILWVLIRNIQLITFRCMHQFVTFKAFGFQMTNCCLHLQVTNLYIPSKCSWYLLFFINVAKAMMQKIGQTLNKVFICWDKLWINAWIFLLWCHYDCQPIRELLTDGITIMSSWEICCKISCKIEFLEN